MQTSYNGLALPEGGEAIQYANGKYTVPDHPIIPFIEGDGTGPDIWRSSQAVFDAGVPVLGASSQSAAIATSIIVEPSATAW